MMSPARFHVPPRGEGASASDDTDPESRSMTRSWPLAKNATRDPSGAQNGVTA
jgi:hypothetical protein